MNINQSTQDYKDARIKTLQDKLEEVTMKLELAESIIKQTNI